MTTQRHDPGMTADLLIEALPYIRKFSNAVMVIKYGGNALAGGDEASALASFAEDIILLQAVGIKPVVVHGGGPQIAEMLARVGKTSQFHDGLRVTDAETLDLAQMVLIGKVNSDIVAALNVHGPLAVGLSGVDANLITADLRDEKLGFVGDVVAVDPTILTRLISQGIVPVIATIGSDEVGQTYNINADTVAGAVASALEAEKLIFLTDVPGVRREVDDPESIIAQATAGELEALAASGAASGGMIPKLEACIGAVRGGVERAHILDGTTPHALLVELFTDGGVGTMVIDA
jgi:acetylglutamate kinase